MKLTVWCNGSFILFHFSWKYHSCLFRYFYFKLSSLWIQKKFGTLLQKSIFIQKVSAKKPSFLLHFIVIQFASDTQGIMGSQTQLAYPPTTKLTETYKNKMKYFRLWLYDSQLKRSRKECLKTVWGLLEDLTGVQEWIILIPEVILNQK